MPATTTPSRPGPVRRAGRWLNAHPRVVVGALLVAASAQVVTDVAESRWEGLFFPAVTAAAAAILLLRDFPRVTSESWVTLRGVDRLNATAIAERAGVEVRRV